MSGTESGGGVVGRKKEGFATEAQTETEEGRKKENGTRKDPALNPEQCGTRGKN
jgi:hypothetical protein